MATAATDPPRTRAPDLRSSPAEWAARYQDHVTRAGARASRTRELNRELIARVARGELAPGTVDAQLNAFVAARGVDYANRLAAMSTRFLTGLIESGTTYSRELVDTIVPGAVTAPDEVAPEFDPGDWANWFTRLTEYAARENAGVTAMLRSVIDKVAAGELAPEGVEEIAGLYHGEHLPESVSKLVGLYFDLLAGLDDAHATFGEEYLTAVLASARRAEAEVALELSGPLGDTARLRLAVANTTGEPTAVRCVVTDLRRADGIGPAFEPDVTVEPERFDLAPGAEQAITLSLRLAGSAFEPGPRYVGTLHVLSPNATLLEVPLRILATRPEPA